MTLFSSSCDLWTWQMCSRCIFVKYYQLSRRLCKVWSFCKLACLHLAYFLLQSDRVSVIVLEQQRWIHSFWWAMHSNISSDCVCYITPKGASSYRKTNVTLFSSSCDLWTWQMCSRCIFVKHYHQLSPRLCNIWSFCKFGMFPFGISSVLNFNLHNFKRAGETVNAAFHIWSMTLQSEWSIFMTT